MLTFVITVQKYVMTVQKLRLIILVKWLSGFSNRRNFAREAEFFVFSAYFHLRNHKTKKKSVPHAKFRLIYFSGIAAYPAAQLLEALTLFQVLT